MNAPAQISRLPPHPAVSARQGRHHAPEDSSDGVRVETIMGREMLVSRARRCVALRSRFHDFNHLLRPAHLASLKSIVEDPEAPTRQVRRLRFLKNANIAAGGVLHVPGHRHRDHLGKKGRLIFTDGDDEGASAEGARDAYLKKNLRLFAARPVSMFEEKNTANNMPAPGRDFFTPARGSGPTLIRCCSSPRAAARPTSVPVQATVDPDPRPHGGVSLKEKVLTLGTAACPPYHLAIVIGGTSAS